MKNNKHGLFLKLLLLPAVMILSQSCSKDRKDCGGCENALVLNTTVEEQLSKAIVDNTWDGGERVNVMVDGAGPVIFTAAANGKLTPEQPIYWQGSTQVMEISAWYPQKLTTHADQSSLENYRASDLVYVSDLLRFSEKNVKVMVFKHKTAKIVVNLSAGNGIGDLDGVGVYFYGYTSSDFDPSSGTVTGTGGYSPVKAFNEPGTFKFKALMIPGEIKGIKFIKVSLNGVDYHYIPGDEDRELIGGRSFTYNIAVTKDGLEVRFLSDIVDWSSDERDVNLIYDYSDKIEDAAFNQYVMEEFDQNSDNVLEYEEISDAAIIDCTSKGISSLRGIEYFSALEDLKCGDNQLSGLDISKNINLAKLECGSNNLTELDISNNTRLSHLKCKGNSRPLTVYVWDGFGVDNLDSGSEYDEDTRFVMK